MNFAVLPRKGANRSSMRFGPSTRFGRVLVTSPEIERAMEVVAGQSRAKAGLALLGDKHLLFSPCNGAFLMYRRSGPCLVAMGDPVGPQAEWRGLIEEFVGLARANRCWPVFYQVETGALKIYRRLGLRVTKLGEEASVNLADFSMEGSHRRRLRQTLRRTERGGGSLEIVLPGESRGYMQELRAVSDAWLAEKNTREKSFSLGAFDPVYLMRCPLAIVRQEKNIVAFANLWLGAPGGELGVDLMRYSSEAPYGVMEYLFVKLFEWGRLRGFSRFNLGMAPLAGVGKEDTRTMWEWAGGTLYRHGEYFYNFRGVREYKSKFQPDWEARYLISPGGARFIRSLASVGVLISGGVRGLMAR